MSARASRRTLDDARRVLRERRWTIAVVTLVFVGVGVLYDSQTPTIYTPSAEIEVRTLTPDTPLLGIRTLKPVVEPEGTALRAAGLATRPELLAQARRRLGQAAPPEYSLDGRTSAAPARAPGSVFVTVQDEDPDRGARAANAVARTLVASITATELDRLDRVIDAVRRERRAAERAATGARARRLEEARSDRDITRLETVRRIAKPAGIVTAATPPAAPGSAPGGHFVPAALLGLSLSIIAAFLLDAVASRPRDPLRLAAAAGLPLLGRVPRPATRRLAAYQQLLVKAEWLGGAGGSKTLLITSAEPSAGKSTVALGMASAAALTGRRACLVECDMHRPVLGSRLGVGGPGLGEWLAGKVPLDAVVTEAAGFGDASIRVIIAGNPTRRPGEVLASPALGELLSELEEDYDVVIVDAPPLLASSDALTMVREADGILLCGRAGRTTLEELQAARAALDRLAGGLHVGLVAVGAPEDAPAIAGVSAPERRPVPGRA